MDRKSIYGLSVALILAASLGGCVKNDTVKPSVPTSEQEGERFRAITQQEYEERVTIKDDALETVAEFTTRKGFSQVWHPYTKQKTDIFLRGYIDKATGAKSYQVYLTVTHTHGHWLHPYQANFGRPLQTAKTMRLSSDVDCHNGCTYHEHTAFRVPESELRRMATLSPDELVNKIWAVKIKTKSGKEVMEGMNPREILALLKVMDAYEPVQMLK